MGIIYPTDLPSREFLLEKFEYLPHTGLVYRRGTDQLAGSRRVNDYIYVWIGTDIYPIHQLIWVMMTGEPAGAYIDHIDGDPSNNSWDNLRKATHGQNQQNRKEQSRKNDAGFRGVYPHGKRYQARITVKGKVIPLGTYHTPEEAYAAYLAARKEHNEFQPIPREGG